MYYYYYHYFGFIPGIKDIFDKIDIKQYFLAVVSLDLNFNYRKFPLKMAC